MKQKHKPRLTDEELIRQYYAQIKIAKELAGELKFETTRLDNLNREMVRRSLLPDAVDAPI